MTKILPFLCAYLFVLASCKTTTKKEITAGRLTNFVDPFIGTAYHGHTYPGAAFPFGQIQLSPDNGTQGWDWCSGYHYSDSIVAGFSHLHLSGTGI
jgi:putative alpha-1,2-mannosidase